MIVHGLYKFVNTLYITLYFLPLFGYLAGSLSFAYWITRRVRGVDVREAGSGHATTTNAIRQAGFGVGAVVLVLDIAKGFLPTYLAMALGAPDWLVGLTAAATAAGHCWPLYTGFRGGMGLAVTAGAVLAAAPLGFPLGLGLLVALTLLLKHGARAAVITGIGLAPLYWVFGLGETVTWIAVLSGAIIVIRFLIDWRREYKELWLDREGKGENG